MIALIPILPLVGAALIYFMRNSLSKQIVSFIACGTVLGAFVISLITFFQLEGERIVPLFEWFGAGSLSVPFEFLIDPLSVIFLLVITGVGFLIHVYSTGYMHDDEGFARYFSYLNLFVFFMLLLVMGNNYLIMFVGWEGVGLCSYLLIGFWFKNNAFNNAAKKAFIMNRIGDLGFLLGIMLIFIQFGSFTYGDVFEQAAFMMDDQPAMIAITLLLFIGAIGKSAQIPLYTWLPDAMAGPTPVSALIHAATMVTAGIYMIARSNILYSIAPTSMETVAVVGLITAIFAATIGLVQNDIKKVLAYSTVSQLGYMFLALGVGAYTAAVFHVVTHAFFKALLFLGAGSVIHGMSGDQDIRNMGGLKKKMPITFLTFLIATIAISGIPPFAGFFSKDEILAHVFTHNKLYWVLGILGAVLTAFYMFRLLYLTFYGRFRGTKKQEEHLHESPKSMTIPLIVLAALSAIGGLIGVPHAIGDVFGHIPHALNNFLKPVFADSSLKIIHIPMSHTFEYGLMFFAVAIVSGAIYFAHNAYVKKGNLPSSEDQDLPALHKLVYNKYYIDEWYDKIIMRPLNWISSVIYRIVEIRLIDYFVNAIGTSVNWASKNIRYLQRGMISYYLLAMVISMVIIFLIKMV